MDSQVLEMRRLLRSTKMIVATAANDDDVTIVAMGDPPPPNDRRTIGLQLLKSSSYPWRPMAGSQAKAEPPPRPALI